jgi:tetratricopeptide (TPR) repeat protein
MLPAAPEKLRKLLADRNQPEVARATAALELGAYVEPDNEVAQALRESLAQRDPQIRTAAIFSLQQEASDATVSALVPLLTDPTAPRLVRTETARALAQMDSDRLRGDERAAFKRALSECFAAANVDNDRAAGHMSLGILYESLGDGEAAIEAYKTATRVEPTSIGPRGNLAAMYDRIVQTSEQHIRQLIQSGNRQAAEKEMGAAFQMRQESERLRGEELGLLERDALLAPDNAAILGRIGLARYLGGWNKEAETALRHAALLEPRNPERLFQLAIYLKDTRRGEEARPLAQRLLELRPGNRGFAQLAAELAPPGR